ncbi:hypothetical protein NIES22_43440 [Calothrix brevissima NIES-22]|nr:hypothetical protein NIES22_43440 [Calothrix brevissima NIES-22]
MGAMPSEKYLLLVQMNVKDKSNHIPAITALLKLIDIPYYIIQ